MGGWESDSRCWKGVCVSGGDTVCGRRPWKGLVATVRVKGAAEVRGKVEMGALQKLEGDVEEWGMLLS